MKFRYPKLNFVVLSFVFVTICSFGTPQSGGHGKTAMRFDTRWWNQANSDEQQGFIYGYMDCRQPQKAAKAPIVDYQNAVSEMMKSQKTSDPKAVTEAIEDAWKALKPQEIDWPGLSGSSRPVPA